MFKSESVYKSENSENVRIIASAGHLEGFIMCGCCLRESKHEFDMLGHSLCRDPKCHHGDLVSLVDSSSETYSLKST